MNDRFKFRIWYEPEKAMMIFNNPTLIDGDVLEGGLLFKNYDHKIKNVHECKAEDFKLMQCTGLKDKNGKLIYEGDILKCEYFDEDKEQMDYDLLKVIFDQEKVAFGLKGRGFTDFVYTDYLSEEYEVVGNIYENKELLNEKR